MNAGLQAPAAASLGSYCFQAVRQFVVRPDRRYRVGLKDDCLSFVQVGNQFHREWLGRGLERVTSVLPRPIGSGLRRLMGASRRTLLITGVALILVASLLLIVFVAQTASVQGKASALAPRFTRQLLLVAPLLLLLLITGIITIIAGFSERPVGNGAAAGPHDFRLPLKQIRGASFTRGQGKLADRMRAGSGRVAVLILQPVTGDPIKLAIPEPGDLEIVESHLLPRLGSRVTPE